MEPDPMALKGARYQEDYKISVRATPPGTAPQRLILAVKVGHFWRAEPGHFWRVPKAGRDYGLSAFPNPTLGR